MKHGQLPKGYEDIEALVHDLRLFVANNWNTGHRDILETLRVANANEKYCDLELLFFDTLAFPPEMPQRRNVDGTLVDELLYRLPFDRFEYHDSVIDKATYESGNLSVLVDLIKEWVSDGGNGWNQIGNKHRIVFVDCDVISDIEPDQDKPMLEQDIEQLNDSTILDLHEVPLITHFRTKYRIPEAIEMTKRLFVLTAVQNDGSFQRVKILASSESKAKLSDESFEISYAITPRQI